jgi:hypothetical protein
MTAEPPSIKRCSFPALLGVLCAAALAQAPPDTIYYNAAIVTMSPDHPTAQAVAIQGGRFAAVGSNAEILKTAGPRTQKVEHESCASSVMIFVRVPEGFRKGSRGNGSPSGINLTAPSVGAMNVWTAPWVNRHVLSSQ